VLTLESAMTLEGVTGREVTDFLLDCDDASYQAWWPGTHRAFHVVEPASGVGHVGDVVWMDEYVGTRRLRMPAVVVEVEPGRIVWQLRPWRLRLPVRLALTARDRDGGVDLRHTVTAGWPGRGRVLDPLWRLYLTRGFARALDRHARTEFPLLRDLLRSGPRDGSAP
jgi:hypothetical protein